ncbi:cytochrome ubiquinol oxidase subunit I [Cellulomonas fengjieae]|uniref:Cytochrome ubiquinol oxidase subunit I n=1 Tax=Cellulomonas fengjieae TaxID=2819978 RepID=A0ABS3SLF3_9CELL|nr:cytochrome ubiquinol oxidase subunit I [Cellulomonas fengjieae]MBO3086573.1 cytochrome ubiquinol oxidase subunit I [Cellulomonas fengjieae]QVI66573.1 cytochrome ubiquinol oxidase subunit I [Cellulomonas fengjieae]
MSAVDAARTQFALLAGFHFLFVLVTLGLGPVVAIFQTRWAVTGREVHERATRFWGQLYLVNYALGIVAGILLELQFGLHFPGLLDVAGEVLGAPLAVETMVAFFLESTLLGLWVFGWHQLNRWVHTAVFWLVVLTGYASALAVMVANGFLRNPVGYELRDGVAHITDPTALVLNPAAVFSLGHVLGACLLAGGFVVIGVSAWHLRRQTGYDELFQRSLRTGVVLGAVGALLAVGFGFSQFSYFTEDAAAGQSPIVEVALGFMIMGGFALFLGAFPMLALMIGGALFRLPFRRAAYAFLTAVLPVPFVLAILGWLTREIGRQPWVVVGVLRTSDATSAHSATTVLVSLVVLVGLIATLAVVDWVLLARLARLGPGSPVLGAPALHAREPDEPLSFAEVSR